jgi:hypothetical protein
MHLIHISLLVVLEQFTGQVFAQINLGTAAPFGVVASSAITNTGATIVTGSLGLFPNTRSSITGFPPDLSGVIHAGDGVANQARRDARTAYNVASSVTPTSQIAAADLGGQSFVAGVYRIPSAVGLTGTLTLDGQNDPNSQFIFQIGSTLTTASSASVVLIDGARACKVLFQIGSSATLGSSTRFNGNILALTSISLLDNVRVDGGLYALNGAVTLINDRIVPQEECVVVTTSIVSANPSTAVSQSPTDIPSAVDTTGPGDISTALTDVTTLPVSLTAITPVLPAPTMTTTATTLATPDQPDQPDQSDQPDVPDVPVITESVPSLMQPSTSAISISSRTPDLPNGPGTTPSSSNSMKSSSPIPSATTSRVLSLSTLLTTTTTPMARTSQATTLSKQSNIKMSTSSEITSTATAPSTSSSYTTYSTRRSRGSRKYPLTYPTSSATPTVTSKNEYYHVYASTEVHNSITCEGSSSDTHSYRGYTHVTSSAYPAAETTHINGIPCTTLTY